MKLHTYIVAAAAMALIVTQTTLAQPAQPSPAAKSSLHTRPSSAKPGRKIVYTGQRAYSLGKKITKTIKGRYLLYLPEDYGQAGKTWPLILFLHGSGERAGGGKIHPKLAKVGLPKTLQRGSGFPFIVLTPQCPTGRWWTDADVARMVMTMLDDVCEKYKVDKKRIYLTGLSMGGFGTWYLAQNFPNRFAAIVPVCGGGNLYLNRRLRKMPVWVFHGAKDKNVPVRNAYEMAGTLRQMGGNVRLKVFPNLGHIMWDQVYTDPKLYQWLMQQRLGAPGPRAKPKKTRPNTPPSPAVKNEVPIPK